MPQILQDFQEYLRSVQYELQELENGLKSNEKAFYIEKATVLLQTNHVRMWQHCNVTHVVRLCTRNIINGAQLHRTLGSKNEVKEFLPSSICCNIWCFNRARFSTFRKLIQIKFKVAQDSDSKGQLDTYLGHKFIGHSFMILKANLPCSQRPL